MLLQFFFHLDGYMCARVDQLPILRIVIPPFVGILLIGVFLNPYYWVDDILMTIPSGNNGSWSPRNRTCGFRILKICWYHIFVFEKLFENVFSIHSVKTSRSNVRKKHSDLWGEFQGWILRIASEQIEAKSCPEPSNCERDLVFVKKNLIRNKYSKDIWKKIPPTKYENLKFHTFTTEVAIFQFLIFCDLWLISGWLFFGT